MVILSCTGIAAAGVVWLGVTGWQARGELEKVRAEVELARAHVADGDLDAARLAADQIAVHASRAHRMTSGPVWAVASRIPLVGDPIQSVRAIASASDRLGDEAVPQLLAASEQIEPAKIRHEDGTIDVARLAAALPSLTGASGTVTAALADVRSAPGSTWVPAVDAARSEMVTQLDELAGALRAAETSARLLPPMLGRGGTKTYFLAFQNDAEARGTGGLPGAFAILRAKNGEISFTRFETDNALAGVTADVKLDKDFRDFWGAGPTKMYINGNLSPHFPYAAQIWASMWEKKSGQKVDGVLAVDPTVLGYLLGASGPATLADGTKVTSGNVVDLTQRAAYAKFANDVAARKRYIVDIARASSAQVMAGHVDAAKLVKALDRSADERRLLVWSADPALQQELAATPLAGAVTETDAPYVGLSLYNLGGNKLDYYLGRSMTWTRTGCGPTRDVQVTVKLTNEAPTGLSGYVIARSDERDYVTKPGDHRVTVNYLATNGALTKSVTVEGKPVTAAFGVERGHPILSVDVEIPRGESRTVVLHLTEPDAAGEPVVLRQPLIRPLDIRLSDEECA